MNGNGVAGAGVGVNGKGVAGAGVEAGVDVSGDETQAGTSVETRSAVLEVLIRQSLFGQPTSNVNET
jgi:hypothetical protein